MRSLWLGRAVPWRGAAVIGGWFLALDALAHPGHPVPHGVSEQLHLHLLPGVDAVVSIGPLAGALVVLGALGLGGLLVLRRRLGAGRDRRRGG